MPRPSSRGPELRNPTNAGPLRPSVPQTHEEAAQAIREANEPPTPMGHTNFIDYVNAKKAEGIKESGIPERIFMGEAVDNRPIVTRQGMRENFPPQMGIGYVPPHVKKEYGFNEETEVLKFPNENDYGGLGVNYLDDFLANNPSARILRNEKNEPYKMKGHVLCALPKAVQESIDQENNAIAALFEQGYACDPADGPYDPDELPAAEVEKRRQQSMQAIAALLEGSHTRGMQLEDAAAMFTDAQEAAMQHKWRWSQVTRTPGPMPEAMPRPGASAGKADVVENARDRATETLKSASRGRTTHAMGATFDGEGRLVRS